MPLRPCLVYQAPWNWDFLWNRAQPLARALATHADVLYLDCGEVMLRSRWRKVPRKLQTLLGNRPAKLWVRLRPLLYPGQRIALAPGLWRYSWPRPEAAAWRTTREDRDPQDCDRLRRELLQRRRAGQPLWLLTSRPAATSVTGLVAWNRLAVDLEDPWDKLSWFPAVPREVYRALLRDADAVFANGAAIAEQTRTTYGVEVHDLPNGIDESFLAAVAQPQPRPPWLPKPGAGLRVAVYTGFINYRFDLAGLRAIVERTPGWLFYFVGKVDLPSESAGSWRELLHTGRVIHVPPVPHEALPAILAHADALLLLYTPESAATMMPAKLLEYIAAARPIICNHPGFGRAYPSPTLRLCADAQAAADTLAAIAKDDGPAPPGLRDSALRTVSNHTWARRAELLFTTLRASRGAKTSHA